MALSVRRRAKAQWHDTVERGRGEISVGSEAFAARYSLRSRVDTEPNTSPEELIGAAHAACFAMSLANLVEEAGFDPHTITAEAVVRLEENNGSFSITRIRLEASGEVPGVDEATFRDLAETAKNTCPISRALAGTVIELGVELGSNSESKPLQSTSEE